MYGEHTGHFMPVRTQNCLTKQDVTLLCVHVSTNRTRQVRISRKVRLYTSTPAFCNMAAHGVPHDAVQRPYVPGSSLVSKYTVSG